MSPALPRQTYRVNIGGRMIAASFRGRSIPQWLIDAVHERLAPDAQTRLVDVENLVRREFPAGGCSEVHELAVKVTRAFRKAYQMDQMAGAADLPIEGVRYERPRG